jgi:hypothetical protein
LQNNLEFKNLSTRFNNLLKELETMPTQSGQHSLVEARASHVISSAVNLMNLIETLYSTELAEDLVDRLIKSIKNRDEIKFKRKINMLKEQDKRLGNKNAKK